MASRPTYRRHTLECEHPCRLQTNPFQEIQYYRLPFKVQNQWTKQARLLYIRREPKISDIPFHSQGRNHRGARGAETPPEVVEPPPSGLRPSLSPPLILLH